MVDTTPEADLMAFTAEDYEALSEPSQAVVGQAFRYVVHLGSAVESQAALPSAFEDVTQRAVWLRLAKKAPKHERQRVRGMLSEAMGAIHRIRRASSTGASVTVTHAPAVEGAS